MLVHSYRSVVYKLYVRTWACVVFLNLNLLSAWALCSWADNSYYPQTGNSKSGRLLALHNIMVWQCERVWQLWLGSPPHSRGGEVARMHKTRLYSFTGLQQSPPGMLCAWIISNNYSLLTVIVINNLETPQLPGDLALTPPRAMLECGWQICNMLFPISFL